MKQLARKFLAYIISFVPKGIFTDNEFFEIYQNKGWHATPVHFYQPIPNTMELPDELWEKHSNLTGIDGKIDEQIKLLEDLSPTHLKEWHQLAKNPKKHKEIFRPGQFGGMDAAVLYSLIREYKPKKIIEIGSGQSTLVSLLALRENRKDNHHGSITSIEPYPNSYLNEALDGVGNLIENQVQNVPLTEFDILKENDILFIDSSHVAKIGSDVLYELLEILPRLNKGVIVHFHDIFLPYEYKKEWVKDRHIFWTEQYLLQAFLAFNSSFEILWSSGLMRKFGADQLAQNFLYFDPSEQQSGSFWIKRIN